MVDNANPVPYGWNIYQESLMDSMSGGIIGLCPDGERLLFCNRGIADLLGHSREEISACADWLAMLVFPEDCEMVRQEIRRRPESGRMEFSCRLLRADGAAIWVNVYAGQVISPKWGDYLLCQLLDDSGTRAALSEAELAKSELEYLLNTLPCGVARFHVEESGAMLLYGNERFFQICGYTEAELAASPIRNRYLEVVHPDDSARVLERVMNFIRSDIACPSIDYRVITKSGEIRWQRTSATRVNAPGQTVLLQCVVNDITEERQVEKRAALNAERYRAIFEQTQDVIYDWDLERATIHHSSIFERKFGLPMPENITVEELFASDMIHEADKLMVKQTINALREGFPCQGIEYRIKTADNGYLWCRNRMTTLYDENHRPSRIIGLISDIDSDKRKTAVLEERAQTDSLTGVLNRMVSEEQVNDRLRYSSGPQVFFLIDVDHFKLVNDTYGHVFGDEVLKLTASRLLGQFRRGDITGRLGGDEFAVLAGGLSNAEEIGRKAEQVAACYREPFQIAGQTYQLSVSIGISCFPQDGHKFRELYRQADFALYQSKRRGRNCYTIYAPLDDSENA